MRVRSISEWAWVVIAVSLAGMAIRPFMPSSTVRAQGGEPHPYYVEPGVNLLRAPDGSRQVYGKVMIDMRNGKIWGFPTLQQDAVYPVDPTSSKSPVSRPFLLGRFALEDTER
ncbi:MAG TPA: hypothetical protein VEI01_24065 [Terriglobales bacterium]|nr:hypothetical protein [Terriglobales bacterium]